MGLEINNGTTLQNGIINSLYTKVQGYTSNLLNTDTKDFADYLRSNFDEIDKNSDNTLSKQEIALQTLKDRKIRIYKRFLKIIMLINLLKM